MVQLQQYTRRRTKLNVKNMDTIKKAEHTLVFNKEVAGCDEFPATASNASRRRLMKANDFI